MADIISFSNAPEAARTADERPGSTEPSWEFIELLFFAYRDFVSDADHVLASLGFGRAHHRVLHFVNRNPGMKVAELLDTLRITKQSLGRVLKLLIDEGYIEQREGPRDRRQRLLRATPQGKALALRLARLQTERINRALRYFDPASQSRIRDFLAGMVDPDQRERVLTSIAHPSREPQVQR
jgi:DNA-binding MarR family transcriptional regulator